MMLKTLSTIAVVTAMFATSAAVAATGMEKGETKSKTEYLYEPKQSVRIAPHFGITFANLEGDVSGNEAKTGISVGALADIGTSNIVMQTGLLYVQRGTQGEDVSIDFDINYLAVPLVAKMYTGANQSGLYLKGGAVPQLLLDAKLGEQDAKDALKDYDLMAEIGVGAVINAGNVDMSFEVSFHRSLTNIVDGDGKLYNQGLGLSMGVLF